MKASAKNFAVSIIASILTTTAFMAVHTRLYSKGMAVVKVEDILADHMKEYGQKATTDEQRRAIAERFAKTIDRVLREVAEDERVNIFVAQAMVSKVPDYTAVVKDRIKLEMERASK